jgi:hypothetical protein
MHPSLIMCAGRWHIDIQCAKCATPLRQRLEVWAAYRPRRRRSTYAGTCADSGTAASSRIQTKGHPDSTRSGSPKVSAFGPRKKFAVEVPCSCRSIGGIICALLALATEKFGTGLQRKELLSNARNTAVQLHDFGCLSPAVRVGQQMANCRQRHMLPATKTLAREGVIQRMRFLEVLPGTTISNPRTSLFDFERLPWKSPCFGSCVLP